VVDIGGALMLPSLLCGSTAIIIIIISGTTRTGRLIPSLTLSSCVPLSSPPSSQLCVTHGVNIRGIFLNKIKADKLEMIRHYAEKAWARYNIPIVACVPDKENLDRLVVVVVVVVVDERLCLFNYQSTPLHDHQHDYYSFSSSLPFPCSFIA